DSLGKVTVLVIAVGFVGLALDEVLVQQVVDTGAQRHVLRRLERTAQVEQGVGLGVLAQGVVDRLVGGVGTVGVGQVCITGSEAGALAAILALQPQAQAVGGLPVELGVGQMPGRIGERLTLVLAALLFAVGKGVVAAQRPAGREPPTGG